MHWRLLFGSDENIMLFPLSVLGLRATLKPTHKGQGFEQIEYIAQTYVCLDRCVRGGPRYLPRLQDNKLMRHY